MIDIAKFETCVCKADGIPDNLCASELSFEEKGKKVKITLRVGEEAKAIAIDPCVCKDNNLKCDGMFLYRRKNKHWMILVELKGSDIEHAFEQLCYMRRNRSEYTEIQNLFMEGQNRNLKHEAFIVSNVKPTEVEKQKLENRYQIRVKAILYSEPSTTIPDIRSYL